MSALELHPGVAAAAVLFALALIFWWARVQHTQVENHIISGINSDMYMYHLPVREFGFARLGAGTIPLWNPYTHCGMPFLATYQAAVFYPLNFPHLILPVDAALSLIYLMHIFLAGLFMYLWMRELDTGRVAAVFGGTAYMLCSFVSYQLALHHIVMGQAWIPLIFFLIHRTFRTERWADTALLGVAVSCQFLAGYMQGVVYTMYGAFAYLAFLALAKMAEGKGGFGHLKRPLAMAIVGLAVIPAALTAFQWLPTYLLSGISARPAGGLAREAILIGGSLHPLKFLKVLTDPASYTWGNDSIYSGTLTLLFASFACLCRKRRRELIFFSALGMVSALVAFGAHTPLFDLYRHLPTGDWFGLPFRLLTLTAFAIATIAAMGLDRLLGDIGEEPGFGTPPDSARGGRQAAFIILSALFILALPKSAGICIFIFLAACLLGARTKSARLVGMLAVLLVGLDLMFYVSNEATYPWITRDVFPELKEEKEFLREHIGNDRVHIFRAKNDWKNFTLNANFGMIEGIRETGGYESLALRRYAEFCAYAETGDEPSRLTPFVDWHGWASDNAHPEMLNLLGARYIVEDKGRDLYKEALPPRKIPSSFKKKKVFSKTLNIYENANALPRAFFTDKILIMPEKLDVLQELADKNFPYREAIILEEKPLPQHTPSGNSQNLKEGVSPGVTIRPNGEGAIDITVDVPSRGFIFLNDILVPGWEARVDGAETKIYRADYLFMAIPVAAGKHAVELEYRPPGFRAGVWTSSLSAALLALGLAFSTARSRTKNLAPWERKRGSA